MDHGIQPRDVRRSNFRHGPHFHNTGSAASRVTGKTHEPVIRGGGMTNEVPTHEPADACDADGHAVTEATPGPVASSIPIGG